MTEENQQQVQQETQRVTTKDPKKVEARKRLAAHNHKKREEQKMWNEVQRSLGIRSMSRVSQYYSIGAVLAVGVIGGLGYYIYQTKKEEVPTQQSSHTRPNNPTQQSRPQTNKFEMH